MDVEALAQTYVAPTQITLTPGGRTTPHLPVVEPSHYIDRVEIARGGMGRIVAARDRRLGRSVAIKELRTDSPGMRARFLREALLTARLQHPSIVSIHEAGVWARSPAETDEGDDEGEPFYAMKLVPGRSLDQVIDAAPTLAGRLALIPHVLAVADALAYAHQQRVIHRDLKPHNVLVGDFGETVVIDWGLAKDLAAPPERPDPSGGLSESDANATTVGDVLGTPAYMPPEQANGEPVDERADVYAIGALLYHLLAGKPAYEGSSAVDVLDRVLAAPPTPLSIVQPGVPIDLLAIVARAMAREPSDRYPDARGLAEDLRRFQAGQLVGAHRYSWRQLARRWLRRNRRAVIVAGCALAIMITSGAVGLSRILAAEARAVDERTTAQQQRNHAEDLMDFMLGDLGDQLRPLNQLALLDRVAKKALAYDAGHADPAHHALALHAIGEVMSATGDRTAALAAHREAVALEAADPLAHARGELALADELVAHGELVEARSAYRDAIAHGSGVTTASAFAKLGDLAVKEGDVDAALADMTASLAVRVALWVATPADSGLQRDLANGHARLGNVLRKRGAGEAALAAYRHAAAIATALVVRAPTNSLWRRDLSVDHEKIGNVLHDRADEVAALVEYRAALAIRIALAAEDPANLNAQRDLSVSHEKIGDLLLKQHDLAGALVSYRADLAIATRLADDHGNLAALRDLAVSTGRLGDLLGAMNNVHDALVADSLQLALLSVGTVVSPTDAGWQHDLAMGYEHLGRRLVAARDLRGGLAAFRSTLAMMLVLTARNPHDVVDWQHNLAMTHDHIAKALLALDDRTGAVAEYRVERDIEQHMVDLDPANPTWRNDMVETDAELAATLLRLREARRLADRARARG